MRERRSKSLATENKLLYTNKPRERKWEQTMTGEKMIQQSATSHPQP
jgi:hypothetical protein